LADLQRGGGMCYAEKLLISKQDQLSPMHTHVLKAEDIINRGGATLVVELYGSDTNSNFDTTAGGRVFYDGIERSFSAGEKLRLAPGESVTLMPCDWHAFWGDGGDVLIAKVLHWAHNTGLHTLALCHGPAALLAAKSDAGFLYDGYKIAVFPDAVDKQTPMIGYLPGPMPWWVCEKLTALGVETINKKADNSVHVDRRLVTGASPQAANNFGRLAATTLLKRTEANS
jgi:hypothetical protein